MMDETIMMAMQLAEEFSGRLAAGHELTKQEKLTYDQLLTTTQTYFRNMDESLRKVGEDEREKEFLGRDSE